MNTPKKQRGEALGWFVFWAAVIGMAVWFFFFKDTPPPGAEVAAQSVASAKETGFWSGLLAGALVFLAGGWFVAEGAGLLATAAFWGLLIVPAIVMSVLCERGDPRMEMFWDDERRKEGDISSYEVGVTLTFIGTVFVLNWGGVPIYATIASWSWYTQAAALVIYVVVGLAWSVKRWDDLAKYLHQVRGEKLRGILSGIRKEVVNILDTRRKIRRTFDLDANAPLPEKRLARTREESRLFEENETNTRALWERFLSHNDANEKFRDGVDDTALKTWSEELERGCPEEFTTFYELRSEEVTAEVSANDHKGQIYLWTMFWPLSMGFRIVRKIVTLKLIRDLFMFMFEHIRFMYDKIAARHEVTIEVIKRTPTAPQGGGGEAGNVEPIRVKGIQN